LLKQTSDKTLVKNALSERAQQIIVEDRVQSKNSVKGLKKLKNNNEMQRKLLQKERKNCERWKI